MNIVFLVLTEGNMFEAGCELVQIAHNCDSLHNPLRRWEMSQLSRP